MKNNNLTPTPMPTRQTAVTYLLTVTDTHGHEYVSVSGSLLHCLEIMGDRTYCFKDAVDTYSRIRRELVASGGAYSRFFASNENDKLPIHLVIINEALLPAKQVQHVEPIAPRGPLLPSLQRAIDALPGNRPRTTEDLDVHVAATVAARASDDSSEVRTCESCKKDFYSNRLMRPRYCPTCASGAAGATASAKILAAAAPAQPVAAPHSSPVKNKCGTNFHGTLSCDRLSKWQQKQYGCTCNAKPRPV